jgi:mannose-6-phosphate isomerase-like protein (cupin superfamily)
MKKYVLQNKPFQVPTGDNKVIKEHFGNATLNGSAFSIAHMIAPPEWSEPHQNPEFDEVTLVIRGRKMIEVDGEKLVLNPGESVLVKKGARVRYSNPFPDETEYVSFCVPAFSIETVNRE